MITPSWHAYIQFSKKELRGIIVLGCILFGSVLASMFFTPPIIKQNNPGRPALKLHLFYFDPNRIDSLDAIQLGIPLKQVRSLIHYRAKGGYFKSPADFSKLYGLKNELFLQLLPYIKMDSSIVSAPNRFPSYQNKWRAYPNPETTWNIDINSANEQEWIRKTHLPIKVIRNIISYRNYKGGFRAKYELKKVYGFSDTLFYQLQGHLLVDNGTSMVINANAMGLHDWQQIGLFTDRQIATILSYRKGNKGKIGWEKLVELCDLSQEEARLLKQKVRFIE